MSVVTRFLTVVLLGLFVVALLPAEPAKTPPTKEELGQWIKDLGADDFDKREEASKKLWLAGQAAEGVLQEAAKSKDEEVRRRSKELLEKFKFGIYPETPQKIVNLINAYQTADPNTRNGLIRELLESGSHGCQALMKLINAEENPEIKQSLMLVITNEVNRAAPALILEGNFDTLEMFLDIGMAGDLQKAGPNYCAYYLMRGKLDAAMYKVKNNKDFKDQRKQEILAYLHRAKGDLKAAVAAAEKAKLPALTDDLLYEAGEWKELARRFQTKVVIPGNPALMIGMGPKGSPSGLGEAIRLATELVLIKPIYPIDIEILAYGAAYHRLAGNKADFDATIAAILESVANAAEKDKPTAAVNAARVLFLNDKPDEALQVLKVGGSYEMAFEILCMQSRYGEAFKLLDQLRRGVNPSIALALGIVASHRGTKRVGGGEEKPSFAPLEILAARNMYSLGDKNKAKALFAKLGESTKLPMELSWFVSLIDAEARVGLTDEAFNHAGQIMDQSKDMGWPDRLLPKLFPTRGDTAEVWFQFLRAHSDQKETVSAAEHLKKVRTLLDGKTPKEEVKLLLKDAEAVARTKMGKALDRWILALAETALDYKLEAEAVALLENTKTAGSQQRLADLHADKKNWHKAAAAYKAAWEADKCQPLALYLYGQALAKSGKEAEGKKLMEQAHWLPLGDPPYSSSSNKSMRQVFAESLMERGHSDAVLREADLLLHVTQPASFSTGDGFRLMALDALAKKAFLKAADGHEKSMLRCLKIYINFAQSGAYVAVPAHVHRLRARGLLDAGKFEEARREIATAQLLLPGDVELATMLVPELEKRGQTKEATELFGKTLDVYEKLCKDYPNCPWAHNSAAWLSVCCGRNLQAAKEHATKAVALAPTSAGHLDTLAEIHFQLGDKDKAIALQKKAIELDPKKIYFRKQLKRLEAGDPKAERPPENDDDD